MTLEAPVVEGGGEDLPIIAGLRSMKDKSAVLQMGNDGVQRLSFPGPSGYTINWGPGAIHVPLQDAMSGHLMMKLAAYDRLAQNNAQVEHRSMTLHATASGEGRNSASTITAAPRSSTTPCHEASNVPVAAAEDASSRALSVDTLRHQ